MAEITAKLVKELRDRTGAGMMDCKKALGETNGDIEKAIDLLREKGIAKAAKKSGRTAAEGLIFDGVSADNKTAVVLEFNSETDFVAKNDEFKALGAKMVEIALRPEIRTVEDLKAAEIDGANGWQKFRYVTLPLLRPTTIYVLTISIYAGLAMFLESYMLWAGNNSPKNIGLTIVGYLYKRGIEKNDMGYACAVGMVLLVIALVINIVQLVCNGTFKREED